MENVLHAGKSRPRLGFQITHIGDDYCKMYLPALIDSCKKSGVDLTVFAGGSLYEPNSFDYQLNAIYNYMRPANVDVLVLLTATLRSYVQSEVFDSFYAKVSAVPVVSVTEPLAGHPCIVTDNGSGFSEAIRHLVGVHGRTRIAFVGGPENNPEAHERLRVYRETLESCGIAVDPELICPGDFKARSGTKAVTLLVEERMVEFDALVAANDSMALSAMVALQARGLSVPADVAVIGFDNLGKTAFSTPPLTTIAQPFVEEAKKAVEYAKLLFRGGAEPANVRLSTELVVRSSCGCLPRSIQTFDRTFGLIMGMPKAGSGSRFESCLSAIRQLERPESLDETSLVDGAAFLYSQFQSPESLEDTEAFFQSLQNFAIRPENDPDSLLFWEQAVSLVSMSGAAGDPSSPKVIVAREKARIVFREARALCQNRDRYRLIDEADKLDRIMQLLLLTRELHDLFAVLAQIVTVLDIRHFFLVTHPPKKTKPDTTMDGPIAGRKLMFAVIDGRPIADMPLPVEKDFLIPDAVMRRVEGVCLVASSVYCLDELFGYLCLEPGCYSMNLYNSLILELGSVIKRCVLGTQQRKTEGKLREALKKLRQTNQRLADLSLRDELTRLYNRRGFLDLSKQSLMFAQRMKKDAMLIFIDLDGLKRINDTWGHMSGDTAITGAAIVLKATFRQVDIIARLGGDEFVVLTLDSPYQTKDIMMDRLRKNIDVFNESNTNAWDLSMSVGVLAIPPDDKRPLEELIKIADALQYEEKQAKRRERQ